MKIPESEQKSLYDVTTVPAVTSTIACQIGKHSLCQGEGTHIHTGMTVACECPCHDKGL